MAAAWAMLPMNVAPYLSEDAYVPSTVPALFGTPPQRMNLTVGVSSGFLATYGSDCILCAGTTMFDPSLSSTFKVRPHFFSTHDTVIGAIRRVWVGSGILLNIPW